MEYIKGQVMKIIISNNFFVLITGLKDAIAICDHLKKHEGSN